MMSTTKAPSTANMTRTEAVRRRCIQAAMEGYEQAAMRGLCHEGAWEIAIGAMRAVDLNAGPDSVDEGDLGDQVARLSARFAGAGAPAAGSAGAATGAMAAGIVEWVAGLARRGADAVDLAADIGAQAAALRADLSAAARRDAALVNDWIAATRNSAGPGSGAAANAAAATDSVIDIARACARVAGLAADLATLGPPRARPDARAAVRLAVAAGEACLRLAEANLRHAADDDATALPRRAVWRLRLLLQRALAADLGEDAADLPAPC